MSEISVPHTNKETKKMKMKNVLADLAVTRKAQSSTFEVYAEDAKTLADFVAFKQQHLGGEITVAEVFCRLVRVLWSDSDFAATRAQGNKK